MSSKLADCPIIDELKQFEFELIDDATMLLKSKYLFFSELGDKAGLLLLLLLLEFMFVVKPLDSDKTFTELKLNCSWLTCRNESIF